MKIVFQTQLIDEHFPFAIYFKEDNQITFEQPDVYALFEFYNWFIFNNVMEKSQLKWSQKMKLCAGTCSYQGQKSCTITLSQPILQFRNNNEIKETILHEMIHGFLFITNPQACQDQGGHGKEFQSIMNEINQFTGLNITIYHSFHDEVDHFRTHIWKCEGPCQNEGPFYGLVKRSMNRAPGPSDNWYQQHQSKCGGKFVKISEPPQKNKTTQNKQLQPSQKTITQFYNKQQSNSNINIDQIQNDSPNSLENRQQNKLKRKEQAQKNEVLSQYFQNLKNYQLIDLKTGLVLSEIQIKQIFKDFSKDHLIMEFIENGDLIMQISVSGSLTLQILIQQLQNLTKQSLKLYLDDSRIINFNNDELNKSILYFFEELMVTEIYLQNKFHLIQMLKYGQENYKSNKILCLYYNDINDIFKNNLTIDQINHLLNKL